MDNLETEIISEMSTDEQEEVIPDRVCPTCLGVLGILGILGYITHYLCRDCGAQFSREMEV